MIKIIKELENWIDEEGCVSYAGLCRYVRDKDEVYLLTVVNHSEHFMNYLDAVFEDAVALAELGEFEDGDIVGDDL